ncbi:MAG TPA: hypothetical protein ENF50_04575 [Archaeoglobus veneficus]|nr:hypothetical protein [Archaeoglobus veneficus]
MYDPRCKICQSPYRKEIDQMLKEGIKYSVIIAKFPELKLNKQNISNHRKHAFITYNTIQSLDDKDELEILDEIIKKAYSILQKLTASNQPRLAEVWGNLLLRAIKLKHEIQEQEDPGKKLVEALGSLFQEPDKEEVEA